jgi:hypothetical protein
VSTAENDRVSLDSGVHDVKDTEKALFKSGTVANVAGVMPVAGN